MALGGTDRDAGRNASGEEDSQSSIVSIPSGNESVAKGRHDVWFTKDEAEKREEAGERHHGPFRYLWDLIISRPVKSLCGMGKYESWQTIISRFLVKRLRSANEPCQAFGHWVQDLSNLFLANGGFFETLYRALLKKELVRRERDSKDYVSILGALDSRFELYQHKSSLGVEHNQDANAFIFPGTDYGARSTADVLVMASKLAYENANYVEEVVTNTWKMHFVKFHNCWNEFQQQESTQVFLFTDQPKNAKAVVVAFRGTEPFNLIDWSTDIDFQWHAMEGLGEVHLGFLEALGLGDRNDMTTFETMEQNASSQPQTENKGIATLSRTLSGLTEAVVDKFLAYDGITKQVKQLMEENPEAKLFVTGHSLGGALANLYTTLLFYNNEKAIAERLGALYTFGQPRVGGKAYCEYVTSNVDLSIYWRVVYSNDIVPRLPFDDNTFMFKHSGHCHYYSEWYGETTVLEAPNANYFDWSLKTLIMQRLVALCEVFMSLFSGWLFGPDFRESYSATGVRLVGLISPGLTSHLLNNYVNAIRLGRTPLTNIMADLELEDTSLVGALERFKRLFYFIFSFMGEKKVPATKDTHWD